MPHVSDFSESALERSGKSIRNYERDEAYGVIKIKYDEINRLEGGGLGAGVGALAGCLGAIGGVILFPPAAAAIALGGLYGGLAGGGVVGAIVGKTTGKIHYFDVGSGGLLGNSESQAAAKLNEMGSALFSEGKFSEAESQFQRAYDVSHVKSKYTTYRENRDKAKNELDAINLNSQGDNLFAQGKYSEAQIKYQEAYDKSQVSSKYSIYEENRDKSINELDAIDLNSQGDNLFAQGKYSEAQMKYQEAYDKSEIAANKSTYAACRNNTSEIMSVFEDFNLMLNSDFSKIELNKLCQRFDMIMDVAENGRHAAIVNRFHVVSLRKARKEMSSQLESTRREDIDDLIAAIMSLIETEIAVLKDLNITDQKLEQELESLEEKLNALEDEFEQSNDGNVRVEIESIALRVDELVEEVEVKALKRLGQQTQLERG